MVLLIYPDYGYDVRPGYYPDTEYYLCMLKYTEDYYWLPNVIYEY